jgi:hypothetical protein
MDLVKGFTDFQRRTAKQQKQQPTPCRFCKWATPDGTAASYLQHLKDAHGDALDKTKLADETSHITWKEIDDALDGIVKDGYVPE